MIEKEQDGRACHQCTGGNGCSKRGTGPLTGVFATRSPWRPNQIGVSIIKVVSIEGTRLTFEGVDTLDGTPVLDFKIAE